jgi:hypothetical protein
MTKMPPLMMLETSAVGDNLGNPSANITALRPTMIATLSVFPKPAGSFLIEPRMAVRSKVPRYDSNYRVLSLVPQEGQGLLSLLILTGCGSATRGHGRTAQEDGAALVF